jgi:pSer/pThr/pTyr-binding forkhead associated (FHA) protein
VRFAFKAISRDARRVALRAFVDLPNRIAVRIGPQGLLLGRHRSCDIQLADESASRRHALLRVDPDGVELVVLGKKPVLVNDRPVAATQALAHGDRVALPGFECTVRVEVHEESVRVDYCLRRGG